MTTLTGPMRVALLRLPPPGTAPQARPKWTHRATLERLLGLGLIEEPSPGLYRRTEFGEAALETAGLAQHPA